MMHTSLILVVCVILCRYSTEAVWTADVSSYDFLLDTMQTHILREQALQLIYQHQDALPTKQHAINNILIGVYDDRCEGRWENLMSFRTAARKFGSEALVTFTTHKANIDDLIAELPKRPTACNFALFIGADKKASEARMFDATGEEGFEVTEKDFSSWTNNLCKASLVVRNWYPRDIDMYWVDEGKSEVHVSTISHGQGSNTNTYMSHIFMFRDPESQEFLGYIIISRAENLFEIRPESEKPSEQDFYKRVFKFWFDLRRIKNYFQPNIVPALTPVGFQKIKAPEKLYQDVLSFFKNQEKHQLIESSVGPCVNQDEAPTYMIGLSHELRQRIFDEFKPILENWSNLKLKPTSLYGIRKYTKGSVLKMHVDTLDTHVILCIVNVAQEVDEDWLLEILDHEGKLHKIAMEPGDMVLYESAKALHGRPVPLKGASYSNFFLHYAPEEVPWDFRWF